MISIIIPAYRTPKMLAYSVAKILEFSKPGELEIIVVNNYPKDTDSKRYLQPFAGRLKYIDYPEDRLQSHGIAVEYCLENGFVSNDYFMVLESDSFPIESGWVQLYEKTIRDEFDVAGSILKLSGGCYLHPNGAIYRKSVWEEAKRYAKSIEYRYFPNMSVKDGFDCHLMVHNSIFEKFIENPEDYIELSSGYKPYSKELALERLKYYSPTCGVFHNGVGGQQESVKTYGERTFGVDAPYIILDNKQKLINRVGYEPGQWYSYWITKMDKKVAAIDTKVVWMKGRENQQQEYTLNAFGIKHLWGISSYTERGSEGVEDIYEAKRKLPEELYETLPDHLKIKE